MKNALWMDLKYFVLIKMLIHDDWLKMIVFVFWFYVTILIVHH